MDVISDYIIELGLESMKDKLINRVEKEKVKKELDYFLKKQKQINEYSTIKEEIDFEGLKIYTNKNLLEDMRTCLLGDREERELARKNMINNAVNYSNAKTEESRKRIYNFMSDVIEILKKFYRSKCSFKNLILKSDVIDDVKGIIREEREIYNKKFEQCTQLIIDKTQSNELSVMNSMNRIDLGRINEVESDLNNYIRSVGSKHELYPYYHYSIKNNNGKIEFISEPQCEEAIKKYPPTIDCVGKIMVGNKEIDKITQEIKEYANRNQVPIKLNIEKAKKKLGNIDDPIQSEAKDLVGKEIVIKPEPFPGPFPFSILIDDEVMFEYILLKVEKIQDDNTVILSNKEQEQLPFIITIKVNVDRDESEINFKMKEYSNKNQLLNDRFIKASLSGNKVVIRSLIAGSNLLEAKLNKLDYNSNFKTIDEEIDFLEKVVLIEKYFNKKVVLPEKIYLQDYDKITYMANLINGEEIKRNWSELSLDFKVDKKINNMANKDSKSVMMLTYVGDFTMSLFDAEYKFSIKRTYQKAKIKNLEKLKKKIELYDVGETIKIDYLPAEKDGIGLYTDILNDTNNITSGMN